MEIAKHFLKKNQSVGVQLKLSGEISLLKPQRNTGTW